MEEKFRNLIDLLEQAEGMVLAFSGGVDSLFLLNAIKISGAGCLAVTASSEVVPPREASAAAKAADALGMRWRLLPLEVLTAEVVKNTRRRCFFCKSILFSKICGIRDEEGVRYVVDGSTVDDLSDYRPGRKAAEHFGVRSPLVETGFTKEEIRAVSRLLAVPGWDRPSSSCLATRVPFGRKITRDILKRIDDAEEFLRGIGCASVRVRDHGRIARIETGEEHIGLIMEKKTRDAINDHFRLLGYRFVSLDLKPYETGSMHRSMKREIRRWNRNGI
jgi:pyridinium-3,5-biscarboxylic acid mononucleotide sulfurtransferase